MNVAVIAEYYPRAADPALGVWAHRQAVAVRDAGADVRVFVLHRLVPPRAALAERDPRGLLAAVRQPLRAALDGIEVRYVPFVSPPRSRSYPSWGAWAAAPLALALHRARRRAPIDVVHAHYAVPAGDAALRAGLHGVPLVVSVHGGDVLHVARRWPAGRAAVQRTFGQSRLVLANSGATEAGCRELGASDVRVVHLGTDLPPEPPDEPSRPGTIVTVANLDPRKRHADVLRALALLRERGREVRWKVIGDGPERGALRALAADLGVADLVEWAGALPPDRALAEMRLCALFVLPSVDEAFGVAYVEAMAGGLPAIGTRGEGGPEEISGAGGGMVLVAPCDPGALAAEIEGLFGDEHRRAELARAARATVAGAFTWERCGRETLAAYEAALR